MSQWATTLSDEGNTTNNSREELLSIEAEVQKIEALRQQISEALQQSESAVQDVLSPVTAGAEPVTEIIDHVIEMYNSGADVETIAAAFGENAMGVIGEAIRTEINVKKHEKKLRELVGILEAITRVNDNNITQTVSREQATTSARLSMESAVTASLKSTLAVNAVDQMVNAIKQDLAKRAVTAPVESQRVSQQMREAHNAMKSIDATLNRIKTTLQSQLTQIESQRLKSNAAELQTANQPNAAKLAEGIKTANTTNIAETARRGQEAVNNAIKSVDTTLNQIKATLQNQQTQIESQRLRSNVAELQTANLQNAVRLAEVVKTANTTNIAETARRGQEIVNNSITQIRSRVAQDSQLANNPAIKDSITRLEVISGDMQRVQQQPEMIRNNTAQLNANQQIGNSKVPAAELDLARNGIKISQVEKDVYLKTNPEIANPRSLQTTNPVDRDLKTFETRTLAPVERGIKPVEVPVRPVNPIERGSEVNHKPVTSPVVPIEAKSPQKAPTEIKPITPVDREKPVSKPPIPVDRAPLSKPSTPEDRGNPQPKSPTPVERDPDINKRSIPPKDRDIGELPEIKPETEIKPEDKPNDREALKQAALERRQRLKEEVSEKVPTYQKNPPTGGCPPGCNGALGCCGGQGQSQESNKQGAGQQK